MVRDSAPGRGVERDCASADASSTTTIAIVATGTACRRAPDKRYEAVSTHCGKAGHQVHRTSMVTVHYVDKGPRARIPAVYRGQQRRGGITPLLELPAVRRW